MTKVVIKDRIRIPKELISLEDIEDRYSINIFKEKNCKRCDNLPERLALGGPNDLCVECPSFLASYKLFTETDTHWSVPQGDELTIRKMMEKKGVTVVDKRPEYPFINSKIKFTANLFGKDYIDENGYPRVDQKKLVAKYMEYETGILQCRPRSGKGPMSINIAIQIGQRTVVLAHKKALLRQFYNTLTRSEPFPFTNIHKLQSEVKKPIVLWAKTRAQLKKYKDCDFLLVNYQKFVRTPDELASIINGHFSTLIVDEAHNSGAEGYLKVVSKCNIKHRIGLSATPKRKDGRHKMISLIMGPVVAKSESVSLIPKITLVQSRAKPKTNYKQWHSAVEFIFSSKERNKEIVAKVIEDIKAGHKAIIIPVDHLKHQEYLAKEFNKIQEDIAICWNEKSDEEAVLKRVEDLSKTTVLIAIRSMIREGVDLLKPSCMHVVVPMTAEADDGIGAPMFDQLVNRVCTPAPNKPKPIVRIWVDNVKMFQGCLKSLFFGEIWPNRYNPELKKGKYEVDKHLVSVVSSLGKDKGSVFKRNWT